MSPRAPRIVSVSFLVISSLCLTPVPSFGDEAPVTLPTITVSIGPDSARPDLDPNNTANFARVAPSSRPHTETFSRDEIEQLQPSNVYDLLSHATGLVATYQGRKLAYTIMMRGDSNYAFVIDGAYVPTATAGRILQTLPVSAIEQVDVVRDSTALTLGPLVELSSASGALNSGFIVIRTHSPSKTEAEVRGSVESYGTVTSSGYAAVVSNSEQDTLHGFVSGFVSHRRSDGPPGYNTWDNSTTGLLKLGLTYGGYETNFTAFQDTARYGFERGIPGQSTDSLATQRWSYAPISTTLLTSNSFFRWDAHNSTLVSLSYNAVSAKNVQGSFGSDTVALNEDRTYTVNANLRHNFEFDKTLLQIGTEYLYYNTPTGELAHAGFSDEEQTFSGYVHAEQKLLNDRVMLDASARVDDHEIIMGVDSYGGGSGNGTGQTAIDVPVTTTTTGTSTTTTDSVSTVTVTPTTTVTTYSTRPTSGPGSGTGGGPGSPGAGTGMGNPYQFYIYTTITTTTYTTTTTTDGVTTSAVTGTSTTTTNTRQTPALNETTTVTTGVVPASGTGSTTTIVTPVTTTTTTTTTSTSNTIASLPYFYNRWLPLAKSYSGGIAISISPQLLATARFSHTEQGGLYNVISATGEPLDPEEQNKWEIGLKAAPFDAFKPGFNLFNIKINNDKVPTSYTPINGFATPLWSETNTQRFGFELLSEGAYLSDQFGLSAYRASWMHLMSIKSSTIAAYPATISHDVVNATFTQKWQDYSATVALTYVAPYLSNFNSYDGGYHSVGNYVTVDLRFARTFQIDKAVAKLSVYGRNITNRKYETVYGFPSWGAVWGSELAVSF